MSDFDGLSGSDARPDGGIDGGTGGVAGSSGASGAGGVAGSSGTGGVAGSSGTGGVAGSSGTGGVAGSSGTGGVAGSSGTGGVAGSSGTGGVAGSSGSSGASGSAGAGGGTVGIQKKGVGAWGFAGANTALADVNISWYLTWKIDRDATIPPLGVEFVPTAWNGDYATPANLAIAKLLGTTLLGFQSPDWASGGNMTVAEALAAWPNLEATDMRLGSPVTRQDPTLPNSWLEQFMTGAASQGLRVDFVCLRWYGAHFDTATAVAELSQFVHAAHVKFGLPIWLTEYTLFTFDPSSSTFVFPSWSQQVAFVEASTALLDSLDFVERYAWFSLPKFLGPAETDETSYLYEDDGTPTETGVAYRAAGTSP
jgi:hypothetical protein